MNVTRAAQRACKAVLGIDGVAGVMGMSAKVLSNKLNPDNPDAHLSPEQLVEVMEITKDFGPLIAMADQLGFVLVKSPCAPADSDEDCGRLTARMVKEFGEFLTEVAAGSAGGVPTRNALDRVEKEGPEAVAAILCQMAWLAKQYEAGKPSHLRAA